MKKSYISLAVLAGSMMLATSCGTTAGITSSNSSSSSNATSSAIETGASLLGNLLSGVLGGSTLSESSIVGTWNYTGADCVFESENLLAKAGGAVAASKVESEVNDNLAKVGIKKGACSFTFNKDNTYTANLGGRTIQGNYTLDTKNKKIKMTYLGGLASMTPHVAMNNGKLSLLIESSKMLTLIKGASALSKSTTASTISTVLSQYNGMYIGMQLSK